MSDSPAPPARPFGIATVRNIIEPREGIRNHIPNRFNVKGSKWSARRVVLMRIVVRVYDIFEPSTLVVRFVSPHRVVHALAARESGELLFVNRTNTRLV